MGVSHSILIFPSTLAGLNLSNDYTVPEEVESAGFQICAEELAAIFEGHGLKKLAIHGSVEGISGKLSTSIADGISSSEDLLSTRKGIYGINKFTVSPPRGLWVFVWEALQDMTIMILGVCAVVSLIVGIIKEGWPKDAQHGLGIIASILLVVFVTATSDYKQSLQLQRFGQGEEKDISSGHQKWLEAEGIHV